VLGIASTTRIKCSAATNHNNQICPGAVAQPTWFRRRFSHYGPKGIFNGCNNSTFSL